MMTHSLTYELPSSNPIAKPISLLFREGDRVILFELREKRKGDRIERVPDLIPDLHSFITMTPHDATIKITIIRVPVTSSSSIVQCRSMVRNIMFRLGQGMKDKADVFKNYDILLTAPSFGTQLDSDAIAITALQKRLLADIESESSRLLYRSKNPISQAAYRLLNKTADLRDIDRVIGSSVISKLQALGDYTSYLTSSQGGKDIMCKSSSSGDGSDLPNTVFFDGILATGLREALIVVSSELLAAVGLVALVPEVSVSISVDVITMHLINQVKKYLQTNNL